MPCLYSLTVYQDLCKYCICGLATGKNLPLGSSLHAAAEGRGVTASCGSSVCTISTASQRRNPSITELLHKGQSVYFSCMGIGNCNKQKKPRSREQEPLEDSPRSTCFLVRTQVCRPAGSAGQRKGECARGPGTAPQNLLGTQRGKYQTRYGVTALLRSDSSMHQMSTCSLGEPLPAWHTKRLSH